MIINEYFDIYCKNVDLQKELDDSLFDTKDKENWIKNLLFRAYKLRAINFENSGILSEIEKILAGDFSKEIADELRDCAINSIADGKSDAALQYPALLKLSDYYHNINDISSYISCLYYAGFVEGEILCRSGAKEFMPTTLDEKIIKEKCHYAEIEDPNIRAIFLMSYHNLCICDMNGREDFERSYKFYLEMEDFWNSELVQNVDGNNEMFINYMNDTRRLWLEIDVEPQDKDTDFGKFYCKSCEEHFNKMKEATGGDVKKYLIQTYGPYLNSRVVLGEMTFKEAADLFYVKYRDYMDQALNGRNEMVFICYGLIPTVSLFTSMLDKIDDVDVKKYYYQIVTNDLSKFGQKKHDEAQVDSAINQTLASICVKSINLLYNEEDKEKVLFNLVIKRQLLTYLHSMMTTKLSKEIALACYDKLPNYFDECGFETKDEFIKYVESAASLHDLGKIFITDIINMQRRRLDEEEFHGIKRHPSLGSKIVLEDPVLKKYNDVILGHHCFYNGKGGYPNTFDNTNSKVKKIIDIVTLADCMDAATDVYSRNYKASKSVREVIQEFVNESSTRYNPDLVNVIANDKALQEKLENICNLDRLEMMYEAYSAGREKYI